jgi:hypothetical protein
VNRPSRLARQPDLAIYSVANLGGQKSKIEHMPCFA